MKKVILPIIISLLLFGSVIFAQEPEPPNQGLTPDSPFYFFDTLGEKISLLFTFDIVKKAEKAFQYAGEKLAEVKAMAEANKIEALKKAGQKYQEYLALFFKKGEEAYEAGKDITKLTERSKQRSIDYLIILSDIHESISEEKAKAEIDNLRKVSRESFGETIWSAYERKMEELRKERLKEELEEEAKMPEKEEKALTETINWKIYKNEGLGFKIKYSPDWIKKEKSEGVGFAPPEKDASLNVAVLDISVHPVTLDEYKQTIVNQCKEPDCEIIDLGDTTLANNPAFKVVYYMMEGSQLQRSAFALMGILTIKDNKLYSVTYESAEYSKYLDTVNAMIDSFEII